MTLEQQVAALRLQVNMLLQETHEEAATRLDRNSEARRLATAQPMPDLRLVRKRELEIERETLRGVLTKLELVAEEQRRIVVSLGDPQDDWRDLVRKRQRETCHDTMQQIESGYRHDDPGELIVIARERDWPMDGPWRRGATWIRQRLEQIQHELGTLRLDLTA